MGHKHSVRDTGAHFTIDQYTRQIKNDSANKTTIVQYDHNSERLTFEMPLYIDGHAMTLCDLIEIHYINISTDGKSQNPGTYEVNDIKAEGNNAVFTWLISQEATQLAGSLSFFIVFKCTENGVTVYRWGTEICKTLAISAGMDNGEAVLTEYPDILAQWKAQIFGASDNAVLAVETAEANALAAIEAAGEAKKQSVLDSIPDEYEALSALADQNHRNKAGAIVLDAEGESIVVNDASEYPLQNLKLFGKSGQIKTTGKNLFDITKEELIVVGSSGVQRYGYLFDITGTYTFSCLGNNETSITCKIVSDGVYGDYKSFVLTANYTVTLGENDVLIIYRAEENVRLSDGITNPQLEVGSEATEYEPYSGGVASPSPDYPQEINNSENVAFEICGKNLLTVPYKDGAYKEHGGLTYTVNEDGSVHVTGTVTSTESYFVLSEKDFGESSVAMGKSNGVYVWSDCLYNRGRHYTLLYFANGNEVDHTYYPQVEFGTVGTDYEEPANAQTLTIPRTLPGVPVSSGGNYTDENGQEWICDEVDLARGVYVQRICRAELAKSSIYLEDYYGRNRFYAVSDVIKSGIAAGIGFCNAFNVGTSPVGSNQEDNTISCYYAGRSIYWRCDRCTTVSEMIALAEELGIVYIYPYANPIETPLSDAEITAFKALHSNKPNTTILNDAGAFMAVEYVADTKTYIDKKIKEMTEGVTA